DQARQELAPARVFDPRGQQAIKTEAAAVEKRQIEEKRLLEISQAQEIKSMQQKRDEEARKLGNASEKARVNKDFEAKISDLKKNHAVEKQQLTVRHKNDTDEVKKVEQIKKVKKVPPGKKKKNNQE
ncbi:MAG: hypothetical protein MUP28_00005, partial [Candidatus Aminicenantes bacterium]|nr:hypothetical protein [Candidatus Aminicenantes bacterium]